MGVCGCNILATYSTAYNDGYIDLKLDERVIYGSSRLGVVAEDMLIATRYNWPVYTIPDFTANATFPLFNTDSTYLDSTFVNPFDTVDYKIKVNKYLGHRKYELSNHLGNVLAVVSDRKYGVDGDNNGAIEHYKPDVLSETDYYAFGSSIKERSLSGKYRFGFNGKELDKETGTQDYGMRIYNQELGKFLSVDPLTRDYPMLSPYQFASNTPVWAIDRDGLEAWIASNRAEDVMTQQDYSDFSKTLLTTLSVGELKFDCANLAIYVLAKYYESKKVELSISLNGITYSSSDTKFPLGDWSSKDSYIEQLFLNVNTDQLAFDKYGLTKSISKENLSG